MSKGYNGNYQKRLKETVIMYEAGARKKNDRIKELEAIVNKKNMAISKLKSFIETLVNEELNEVEK